MSQRIIGLMVCGPGEKYLKKTLDEFNKLTDDAVICLNGEDKKRDKLIQKYGFWMYRDDREWGKFQPAIKTDLLAKVGKLRPDWILPLDADETFEKGFTRAKLEELTKEKHSCYFYIINLWNEETRYSKGLSFWNIRFFKWLPDKGTQYLRQALHCGLAPPYFYHVGTYVPHLVLHRGLMDPKDRERKYERYRIYDPERKYKPEEFYSALIEDKQGNTFVEEDLKGKVAHECSLMKYQKKYV
jgi:hypothetical protein